MRSIAIFRSSGELALERGHHAAHVQRVRVARLPWLEPDEERAEVRLERAGQDPVAADRVVGVHPVGLRQDLLDPGQDPARALERGSRRELHVDREDALVLLGHEAGGQHAAEEPGAHDHGCDEHDRQPRAAHQEAADADVAGRRVLEALVEEAEELPERPAHGLRRLEQHGRERGGERERAEGREQHRDRDRERELLVHPAGEPAQEGDRDEPPRG